MTKSIKKIIINILPEETRVALFENKKLVEVLIERQESGSAEKIVGNIYKGKVKNVLPGMQAVFVDIGASKNAFLYLGNDSKTAQSNNDGETNGKLPAIGQDIMVQIIKETIGSKGPRAAVNFTLPGRYIVLMPLAGYIGVSKRIEDASERCRLREIAEKIRPEGMGLVVRTAAEGHSEEELVRDLNYLNNLWNLLKVRYKLSQAPALLHRDADLVIRMVRDYLSGDVEEFIIDNEEVYLRVVDLIADFSPELKKVVKLYKNEDIFSYYDVETELNNLNQRRVELKSGGYIIIDYTEALTVIDVNTGRYVGENNLAQTVFETNLEAAAEIVRQIRLRGIGGVIIVDFIDMQNAEHQKAILSLLEEHLKKDPVKSFVIGLTKLGLVEITRKKARQNIEAIMYHDCPCCAGRGRIKSPEAMLFDIKRELFKLNRRPKTSGGQLVIQIHPYISEFFKKPEILKDIEKYANKDVTIECSAKINPEIFSILWRP